MKGAKLKDVSNKQLSSLFKSLIGISKENYPELLNRCFFVNTPIFFQDLWEHEFLPLMPSS
jgi:hypothetical protein